MQFVSEEFKEFAKNNGIKHVHLDPTMQLQMDWKKDSYSHSNKLCYNVSTKW